MPLYQQAALTRGCMAATTTADSAGNAVASEAAQRSGGMSRVPPLAHRNADRLSAKAVSTRRSSWWANSPATARTSSDLFVGPAGKLLATRHSRRPAFAGRGLITNAGKHFKGSRRGKRRLPQDAGTQREIEACLPWASRRSGRAVEPKVTPVPGRHRCARRDGSAGPFVTESRGQPLQSPLGKEVIITIHPAYILRLRTGMEEAFSLFVSDVGQAAKLAGFEA